MPVGCRLPHLARRRVLQLIVRLAQAVRRRLSRRCLALGLERRLVVKGGQLAALQRRARA